MFFGAVGILMSNCVAYLFLCVFVFYSLRKMIGFNFYIDIEFIKKSFNFSSGNYIANILYNAIYTIPPIMVLNVLGDAEAAKYYIAFTIGTFFFQIPFSISTSLFVEGSYGESLRKNVIRSIKAIYMILVPAVIFILLFGQYFLSIFGKDYAGSVDLLRLISISSFFFAIYSVMVTIQNVKMNVKNIMILNLFLLVLLLALSYIFMSYFGIAGVGLAFLTTFIAVDIIIIAWAKAKKWI
jgi:O-antigen/teichoic acid export membrane protein